MDKCRNGPLRGRFFVQVIEIGDDLPGLFRRFGEMEETLPLSWIEQGNSRKEIAVKTKIVQFLEVSQFRRDNASEHVLPQPKLFKVGEQSNFGRDSTLHRVTSPTCER